MIIVMQHKKHKSKPKVVVKKHIANFSLTVKPASSLIFAKTIKSVKEYFKQTAKTICFDFSTHLIFGFYC